MEEGLEDMMQFRISDMLLLTLLVAFGLGCFVYLKRPGVMVRSKQPQYELWFEEDGRIWIDRQLKYYGLRT